MSSLPTRFPPETFATRRERVLAGLGAGALVLPGSGRHAASLGYPDGRRPDRELYYLTGVRDPAAVGVLLGGAPQERFVLFVPPVDPAAVVWTGPREGPEQARKRYRADAAHPLTELSLRLPSLLADVPEVFFRLGSGGPVQSAVLEALRGARARGAREGTGPRRLADPGLVLDELRLRKDGLEVDRLRRAAEITAGAFEELGAALRPGVGEWELQAVLEGAFRRAGADGPAYPTIVGSGPNACILHYASNHRRIEPGDLVLVDAAASWGLYAADLTRTFPADGRFRPEQEAVYQVVEAARRSAVAAVGPGVDVAAVHAAATRALTVGLIELGVVEGPLDDALEAGAPSPFFPHRTSHWLGLDVHDVGDYVREGEPRVLEPGMVLTVEPGLYFGPAAMKGAPGSARRLEGIGVRLEDDLVVTADGCENLTGSFPTDADAVASRVGG